MPGTSLTCPGHEMANETRRAGRGDAIVVQHTAHMHTQTVAQADWRHSGKLADAGCVHDNRQRWIRRIIKFTSCLPRSSWLGSDSFLSLSLSLTYTSSVCLCTHSKSTRRSPATTTITLITDCGVIRDAHWIWGCCVQSKWIMRQSGPPESHQERKQRLRLLLLYAVATGPHSTIERVPYDSTPPRDTQIVMPNIFGQHHIWLCWYQHEWECVHYICAMCVHLPKIYNTQYALCKH